MEESILIVNVADVMGIRYFFLRKKYGTSLQKRTALTVVENTKKIDKFKEKKERVCKVDSFFLYFAEGF